MRRRARTDANHTDIVQAFRRLGCTVLDLSRLGSGCPDALVGIRGRNYLVEIKDGSKPPSARKLTPDEEEFFREWRGFVMIVESLDDVERMVRAFSMRTTHQGVIGSEPD